MIVDNLHNMEELLMNYLYGVVVRRTKRKSTLRDILAGPTSFAANEGSRGWDGWDEGKPAGHA
jgi:hypothetical protein